MAIQYRVAQTGIAHPYIKAFVVGTFREPDPQWLLADQAMMFSNCGAQLGPNRFRVFSQQWQVAVCGTAGEQVEHSLLLQGAEASDQITVAVVPAAQVALKATLKVQCSGFAIAGGLLQQLQARLNPVREAFVEGAVCEQRQQGW